MKIKHILKNIFFHENDGFFRSFAFEWRFALTSLHGPAHGFPNRKPVKIELKLIRFRLKASNRLTSCVVHILRVW